MALEPWYKVVTLRREVREGRSFSPDEFAIALEHVVAGTAPEDYRDPAQFFARTCFTRALKDHTGMVLRRLSGRTENTSPVLTLITQFGGGKTHTLTSLYHLARAGAGASQFPGVGDLLNEAGITKAPDARVGVFVGNAWDPQDGRETPWIDVARQLAGEKGVKELGPAAKTTPPGTEAIARVFKAANAPVLLLFDEVLNFLNRHRGLAEPFHAFIQNLTVATTATTHGAAVISLPRSQIEMTDWDMQWQDKITKVVRRVAQDLIANDEAEISEVIRRRLFEDIGNDRQRKKVSKAYADWCFERRAQLPSEWTAVDSATTESKAREYLRTRFETCFPFHPSTLSVFQRKWQALAQYQQTRGTLAMLAQWISWAFREGFTTARTEPLITLGSAPLEVPEFRSVVLGQLGESRLVAAIDADVSGAQAHARALDADTKGALRDIHRRVGTTIFFESSGGQIDKVAHLPELRFALGDPDVDTTSVDNAALALEDKTYFIRRIGSDGFKISHQPTMKKVVSDRRASLDEDTEIRPVMRSMVQREFDRGAALPIVPFPADGLSVQDTPKLTLVVVNPESDWTRLPQHGQAGTGTLREQIRDWTTQRGTSPRLYPASLVWCVKKPGRDLRDKIELMLAWKRVAREVADGTLGGDFDRTDRTEIQSKVTDAETAVKDEIWGSYRFVVIADGLPAQAGNESNGLKVIDLGAGHSSGGETLCARVLTALKSQAILNDSVGIGYIERNWPPALMECGAWPMASLRQSFLNGSLTRLLDPDATLRAKVVEFVNRGDFGLASGRQSDGTYERMWFKEPVPIEEVTFDSGVFLLRREKAMTLRTKPEQEPIILHPSSEERSVPAASLDPESESKSETPLSEATRTIRLSGDVPPETWNRLGTKLLPKLRSGANLKIGIEFSVTVNDSIARGLVDELKQILTDLGLSEKVNIQ